MLKSWHIGKILRVLILFSCFCLSAIAQEVVPSSPCTLNQVHFEEFAEKLSGVYARIDSELNEISSVRPTIRDGVGCIVYDLSIPTLSLDSPMQIELKEIEEGYNVFKSAVDTIDDPLVDILKDENPPPLPRKAGARFFKKAVKMSDLNEDEKNIVHKAMQDFSRKPAKDADLSQQIN